MGKSPVRIENRDLFRLTDDELHGMRVCREVRVFPLLDLDACAPDFTEQVLAHFSREYEVCIEPSDDAFLKGANRLLHIRHRPG